MNLSHNQELVRVYYSKLKTLIDELVNYESILNCAWGGLKAIQEYQERDHVMKILMGLDHYKAMKAQILMIKPLSSLRDVFSTTE